MKCEVNAFYVCVSRREASGKRERALWRTIFLQLRELPRFLSLFDNGRAIIIFLLCELLGGLKGLLAPTLLLFFLMVQVHRMVRIDIPHHLRESFIAKLKLLCKARDELL